MKIGYLNIKLQIVRHAEVVIKSLFLIVNTLMRKKYNEMKSYFTFTNKFWEIQKISIPNFRQQAYKEFGSYKGFRADLQCISRRF